MAIRGTAVYLFIEPEIICLRKASIIMKPKPDVSLVDADLTLCVTQSVDLRE